MLVKKNTRSSLISNLLSLIPFTLSLFLFISIQGFAQSFIRKPYLQKLSYQEVTIKFRLKNSLNAKVFWGENLNDLNFSKSSSLSTTDHSILVDNLKPKTKYFYKVQADGESALGDSTYYFITAPKVGTPSKFSFWSIGDLYPGQPQQAVLDGFLKFRNNKYTNLFLSVGDNVYCGGTDDCYQSNFFDVYQNAPIMHQAGLFPSTGNHDYDSNTRIVDSPGMPYYSIFDLPSKGEMGGVPSNSEGYFSYNYANVHFVVLESHAVGKDNKRLFEPDNIQLNWLKDDLTQNKQDWTIVYFHYPLYTKGSYDSDAVSDLIKLRETLAPIFDQFKVDLVLTGHSHTMERSKPTLNHYGLSNTFQAATHQPQNSSGAYNGTVNSCPYFFDQTQPNKSGVIYVTNGASGATGRPSGFGHLEMMQFDKKDKVGSFFAEVDGNKLVGKFIDDQGEVMDHFTVFKSKDGSCSNCFVAQPNYGCGPSGVPSILNFSSPDFCQGQTIELTAKGDENSIINWTDLKGQKIQVNKNVINSTASGSKAQYVSQTVNGFESEKLLVPIYVHQNPILENSIIAPSTIYAGVLQDFSVKLSDSIKTYSWTPPAGWEGSSNTNTIKLKPSAINGDLKVFGTSSFGCKSNEVKQTLQVQNVLGIEENGNEFRIYPNPVTSGVINLEVPKEMIGKSASWTNSSGQTLSTFIIYQTLQQIVVPRSMDQVFYLQVGGKGLKVLSY